MVLRLSSTMRRLGITTVVTPTLISSTASFARNLNLPSPLRNHHLTNSICFLKSRSLLLSSFSSSSSAAYLPSLDEFASTKGDFFDSRACPNPDFRLVLLRNVVAFDKVLWGREMITRRWSWRVWAMLRSKYVFYPSNWFFIESVWTKMITFSNCRNGLNRMGFDLDKLWCCGRDYTRITYGLKMLISLKVLSSTDMSLSHMVFVFQQCWLVSVFAFPFYRPEQRLQENDWWTCWVWGIIV